MTVDRPDRGARRQPTASYDYTDETGQLLFQVVHFEPKDFRQCRPDGTGGWAWDRHGVRLVPYRLHELAQARPFLPVLIAEGEKDVDNLVALGFLASCNPGGAGQWRDEFNEPFRHRHVVILPDNDEPGRQHARDVARQLCGIAAGVTVLELPGLPQKGDVSDWIAAGGDKEQLLRLAAAAPAWKPPGDAPPEEAATSAALPEWPDPIPLGEAVEVPEFPAAVLPVPVRRLAEETAWALNVPLDLVALPLLALAGGALANARHVALTPTHTQPPCLYAGVISPPGGAKSPVLKLLRRPLDYAQKRYLDEWRQALAAWEQSEADDRGPRPVPTRCIVSDITTESLGLVLSQNPRGVVLVKDELLSLVTGLNQYKGGKGSDRQVYLALWGGETITIDRKSDRSLHGAPLYVTEPFTAIVGGIQPDVLPRLRGEPTRGLPPPDDGFLDRFLFVYPKPLPAVGEEWREVSPEARKS
jgi:hypothetical protein